MMQPMEVVRLFTGTDAYMTETARVTHGLVMLDLPRFTAFDTTINATYVSSFLASVVAAEIIVADSAVIDQQVSLTENVQDAMERARLKFAEVKYFVVKAFPKSPGTQNEIGLNDYQRARKNQSQMAQFLKELHLGCTKYQAQLIAAGFNAASIAAILPLRDELLAKNTSQKVFKKQRPKLTEDRVTILNTCYEKMALIMAAGQLVYSTDYAKRNQFVYLSASKSNDSEEYSGTVAANAIAAVATVGFDEASVLSFKNTGVAGLTFCLSKTNAMEGNLVQLAGGATISKTMSELQADGVNILVKNNDSALDGSYLVEVNY